jgi:4-amino-4-deoxy-L-arabinose transferase-like glycosyltransferase
MNKFIKEWKFAILGLVGVLTLGFLLRIVSLTLLPVFADEAIYIRWSQIMASESTLRFLPLSDGKQPLFMWVLMFIIRQVSDPLFVGRLSSVISGLGTILGIFIVTQFLFKDKKISLVASLIWAISPIAVFFDRMALVDSMLTMLGVFTFLFGYLTAKTKRLDMAIITGFFLGFSLLTKSPAIFFVLLLPSMWIFGKKKLRMFLLYLATLVVAFGMYNILRLGPNFHLIAARNLDYVYPYSHILSSPLDPFVGHFKGIINYFVVFVPFSLIPLFVLGAYLNFKNNLKVILPLLSFAIIPILIVAEYSKVVTARYILFTIPFFTILAASTFATKIKWVRYVSFAFLAIFICQSLIFDYKLLTKVEAAPIPHGDKSGYLEEWTAGQGIKEISEFIKKEAAALPEGEKIVVGTEGYFGTLPDGLQMYLTDTPNVVVIGIGVGIRELPQSLRESKESGNKTYLVINKSRFQADPEDLGLKVVSEYPKIPRRTESLEYKNMGSQEILYFFELTDGN